MSTSDQNTSTSTGIRLATAILGGITLLASLVSASPAPFAMAAPDAGSSSSSSSINPGYGFHSLAKRSSAINERCIERYNTSRADPFPLSGYFNPNNASGSMLTVSWRAIPEGEEKDGGGRGRGRSMATPQRSLHPHLFALLDRPTDAPTSVNLTRFHHSPPLRLRQTLP